MTEANAEKALENGLCLWHVTMQGLSRWTNTGGSYRTLQLKVELSPSLRGIQENLARVLKQSGEHLKVVYFVFDGEQGHNDARQLVRQVGLPLVSKLRYNTALYFPYEGP